MHDYSKSNRGQQFVMKLSKDPHESVSTYRTQPLDTQPKTSFERLAGTTMML